MLRLHDTARRAVVEFVPREPGRVSMYVCGPTPYDVPHLGHGRKEIVFDTIRRYLVWRGFEVTYVSNVTDIEDKIIAKATAEGSTEPEVARRFEAEFRRQFDRLNVLPPTHEPHATEWIGEMISLIADLVDRGHAYAVEGQGVYFAVESLVEYGALSHRSTAELLGETAGAQLRRQGGRDDFASLTDDHRSPQPVRVGTIPASVTTRPIRFSGANLFVNAAMTGALTVEVLDAGGGTIPGFTASDCSAVGGDGTRLPVRWRKRALAELAGETVRFRFRLDRGRLFAFWVSASPTGSSNGYLGAGGPGYRDAIDRP